MRALFLAAILVLVTVACTVQQPKPAIACDAPNILVAGACCPDANGDGACDAQEREDQPLDATTGNETVQTPPVNATVEESDLPGNETLPAPANVTAPVVEAQRAPSITENYTKLFTTRVKNNYGYYVKDDRYGRVFVFVQKNFTKYVSQEYLFEIAPSGDVVKSDWTYTSSSETFWDDLESKTLKAMNYVWKDTNGFGGCYVSNGYYKKENCFKNGSDPIVHEGIAFTAPASPLEYLQQYAGKTPVKTLIEQPYSAEGTNTYVDLLFFENADGTVTKLYIHESYGIPLRVDVLKNNVVKSSTVFEYFAADNYNLNSWYKYFLDQ